MMSWFSSMIELFLQRKRNQTVNHLFLLQEGGRNNQVCSSRSMIVDYSRMTEIQHSSPASTKQLCFKIGNTTASCNSVYHVLTLSDAKHTNQHFHTYGHLKGVNKWVFEGECCLFFSTQLTSAVCTGNTLQVAII